MKETIRRMALALGADVCGFVPADAIPGARPGFTPTDVWPDAKTVVMLGYALPKALMDVSPRLVYGHFNHMSAGRVDGISLELARAVEAKFPCRALPVPGDNPYEYWETDTLTGRGLFSMKHAAQAAGLGQIGKSTLLLSPAYGSRLTLGALLLDTSLPGDPPCEPVCLPTCHICEEGCPAGAIQDGCVTQKPCRENTYHQTTRGFGTVDCNRCRSRCPMRYGKKEDTPR